MVEKVAFKLNRWLILSMKQQQVDALDWCTQQAFVSTLQRISQLFEKTVVERCRRNATTSSLFSPTCQNDSGQAQECRFAIATTHLCRRGTPVPSAILVFLNSIIPKMMWLLPEHGIPHQER